MLMKEIEEEIKQMERYTMFKNWQNQYCQNDYATQETYRINASFIKLPMAFFTELEKKNSKLCMETQKTQIAKETLKKRNDRIKQSKICKTLSVVPGT